MRDKDSFFFSLGSVGASIYTCSGVGIWLFGLEANALLALVRVLKHHSQTTSFSVPFALGLWVKVTDVKVLKLRNSKKKLGIERCHPLNTSPSRD